MKRIAPLALAPLLVAAPFALLSCSPGDNDPGPGGVTVDEARALDEAAEMIEAKRLPEDALPEGFQADAPVELPPGSPAANAAEPETGE